MRAAPRFLQGGAILPRPVLWAIVALSLGAGVLGFVSGRSVADLTESEVLTIYGALYSQQTGAAPDRCVATPGRGNIWLILRCGTGDGARRYHVARDGGLITQEDGPSA